MIRPTLIALVIPTYLALSAQLAASAPARSLTQDPAPEARPCQRKAEHRQFDFWVGEWDVTSQGKVVASSTIQSIVADCVILENYSQGSGYSGKSLNFYDETLKKWRQTWVDSIGNVSEFVGEYRDKAMRFEGESHLRGGTKVLRRMILYDLGPDRVRQYSERSVDGGQTWNVAYDFIYLRKKTPDTVPENQGARRSGPSD